MTVIFGDGLKLFSQYQGSSDTFYPALFDSSEEAWSYTRRTTEGWAALTREENGKYFEKVEVENDYGGRSSGYEARACRATKQLRVWHSWLDDGWSEPYALDDWLKGMEREMERAKGL